jgi:ribosome biogenesis GTPase
MNIETIPSHILNQVDIDSLDLLTRVCGEERDVYFLLNGEKLNKKPGMDLKVGDWLVYEETSKQLDPMNFICRIKNTGVQEIARNVDQLWILTSVNSDLNYNRIERYIHMALNAEATPVVVLTKIDLILADELQQIMEDLKERFNDVEVLPISTLDGKNLEQLDAKLDPRHTIALMGSSGVGKSTLINYLRGNEEQFTQGIRQDGKGRHTTTNRRMFSLENGCAIIDNPGIRGVGVLISSQEKQFHCKFSNCTHNGEPGCEVQAQIEQGILDPDYIKNMQKMAREAEYYESLENVQLYNQRRKGWKKLSKQIRKNKV